MARRATIELAGGPSLRADDAIVARRGPTRRGATLVLAYLALHEGHSVPADDLAHAVWGDDVPASWTASLRKLVSDARTWLDAAGLADAVSSAHGAYRLDLPAWAEVDVLAARRKWAAAPADCAGEISEGLRAPLVPGFDAPWLNDARGALQRTRLDALELLAETHRREGRLDDAIVAATEAFDTDPLRESACRLAMVTNRDAGRIGAALRLYERCRAALVEELGVGPSQSTAVVYQSLLSGQAEDVAEPAPSGDSANQAAHFMDVVATRVELARLESRLVSIEANPHPDPLERIDVMIAIGRARWTLNAATDYLRRISFAAGEAALALGAAAQFGTVLNLASTTTGVGRSDEELDDMCVRGLDAFAANAETRARALGLRAELRTGLAAVAFAEEAVAVARSTGNEALVLDCLQMLDQALSWSPDLARRLEIETECADLLTRVTPWRSRPTFEPLTRLQLGDVEWLRAEAEQIGRIDPDAAQWEQRFYAKAFAAVLAHLAGELDAAEALAQELLASSSNEINAVHAAAGLYLVIVRDKGTVGDVLPALEAMAQSEGLPTFNAALALGYAYVNRIEDSRRVLDEFLAHAGDDFDRDHTFTLTAGLAAEAVWMAGATEHAPAVAALLEPYAGQLCAGAHGTVVLGSIDYFRGLMFDALGDRSAAEAAFAAGAALEERIGAPLMQARTVTHL